MYLRTSTAAITTLALAFSLGACGDATGTGDIGFEPAPVESAVDALVSPVQVIGGPTAAVRSAFPTLEQEGLSYDRASLTALEQFFVRAGFDGPGVATDLVFPTALRGETFVLNELDGEWTADSTRTDAPSTGVRVIWYTVDVTGQPLVPLEEQGHVDLTDEDAGEPLSQLGIRMVSTSESGSLVLAELTEAREASDATQWSEHFESEGYYGGGVEVINFTVVSDASGDSTSGDQDFDFTITMDGPEALYTLNISGTETGANGVIQQNVVATVILNSLVTELDLDITVDESGGQSGGGTVSHDGGVSARVTISGNDFSYTDADGASLPSSQDAAIDSLVRTLYLAGLSVFVEMPLLML